MSRVFAALASLLFLAGCAFPGTVLQQPLLDQPRRSPVLKSSSSGTYRLSYAVAVPAGHAGGPQQLDFNGTIKSNLSRI